MSSAALPAGHSDLAGASGVAPSIRSIWVSLENGEQLHLRHFLPASPTAIPAAMPPADTVNADIADDDEINSAQLASALASANGRSVFMLHGEAECGRVYYDGSHRGLAHYLVRRGYEVFVADLGGRGRSLGPAPGESSLTVQQLVCEAIPALLRCARRQSVFASTPFEDECPVPGPHIWIAHGFGAALLSAAWVRLPAAQRCAQQWVFFAGRRRLAATQRAARLFVKLCCHPLTERWVNWCKLFPATRLGLGSADENAEWFRTYTQWIYSSDWRDKSDGFDYQQALAITPVPPTMHLAAAADDVFSNLVDVRAFIAELGPHDARLLVVDQIAQSKRRYNHLAMLLDEAAEQDIFEPLEQWLQQGAYMMAYPGSGETGQPVAQGSDGNGGDSGDSIFDNEVERPAARQPWQRDVAIEAYYNRPEKSGQPVAGQITGPADDCVQAGVATAGEGTATDARAGSAEAIHAGAEARDLLGYA